MRVPPFRDEFLVAKKPLPDRVHPFQFLKPILDRCDFHYFLIPPKPASPNPKTAKVMAIH
jgi:hypothetical protein